MIAQLLPKNEKKQWTQYVTNFYKSPLSTEINGISVLYLWCGNHNIQNGKRKFTNNQINYYPSISLCGGTAS